MSKYEVGVTKFKHKTFGEGVLLEESDSVLKIDFSNVGVKNMSVTAIKTGHLSVLPSTVKKEEPIVNPPFNPILFEPKNKSVKQYDTSPKTIGGKNIIESFCNNEISIFNESYTVIGSKLKCAQIKATYDLTIIGDVEADEIAVNGELFVTGNLKTEKLNCYKSVICNGDIDADIIYVSGDIIARSIRCDEFVCDGNALIKTTIDINESAQNEKTMFACEGIMGAGKFFATNAIANEYFEFSGDIDGNIIELETNTALSKLSSPVHSSENSLEDIIKAFELKTKEELEHCFEWDEKRIQAFLNSLANTNVSIFVNGDKLFCKLIDISYQDEITDFGDYLIAVYTKQCLPKQIYLYETVEHIFSSMLPEAEKHLETLMFEPSSLDKIAESIEIVLKYGDFIAIPIYDALDKIFSSFGLRYATVKKVLSEIPKVGTNSTSYKQMHQIDFLNTNLTEVSTRFGITEWEVKRLAEAKILTCGEFINVSKSELEDLFGTRLFEPECLMDRQEEMKDFLKELI